MITNVALQSDHWITTDQIIRLKCNNNHYFGFFFYMDNPSLGDFFASFSVRKPKLSSCLHSLSKYLAKVAEI